MPKERMERALEQLKAISEEDYAKVKGLANVVRPLRSVIHKTPDDYGMTGRKDLHILRDRLHPSRQAAFSPSGMPG
jgi:hypothetical protein